MPISTMGIGIARNGTVERYVPPRVIEEAGGGGPAPGPGPLLSSALAAGPITPTATWTSWQTLALPAGTFDVWAVYYVNASAAAIALALAISLNGTAGLPSSNVVLQFINGGSATQATTCPAEITLAAPQTIHFGGSIMMGGATTPVSNVTLFARQLA